MKNYLIIKWRQNYSIVDFNDIVFIESNLRKAIIHGEKKDYCYYISLNKLEYELDERFYRCHNECIVNFDKVKEFSNNKIYLKNNGHLKMSEIYIRKAKKSFLSYVMQIAEEEKIYKLK